MSLESIALIPSGYKATKVYSQLPVNGNGDFTYDRGIAADQATRVNKNGLIEDVALDVPRLDYLDGGCPSLLLEPATTNLITYPEDFSNIAWTTLGSVTTNTNVVLSPDGSVNADEIVSVATGTQQGKLDGVSATIGLDYTFSVFVKYKDAQYIQLVIGGLGFGGTDYANFDIQNGLIGNVGVADSADIVDYGNGWYRISLTATASSTNTGSASITFVDSLTALRNATFSGTIGSGVYLFGGQLEQQSYATSYVRSLAGVSGVRNAETCNGAGTTAEINSQEGVLYAELKGLGNSGTNRMINLGNGSSEFGVILRYGTTNNTIEYTFFDQTGALSCFFSHTLPNVKDSIKVACNYKINEFKFYVNGVKIGEDLTGNTFSANSLNRLRFDSGTGLNPFYGRVSELKVYDTALTDAELTTLTTI